MTVNHYSIGNLYLVQQDVHAKARKLAAEVPANHLVIIDCSGSMSGDLPRIREQLKRQLPKLLKQDDTISLVWFSGRGQCGALVTGETVASLRELKDLENTIDRWLKPVGMTGFKEPLELVPKLVKKIGIKNPYNLLFLTDGCDNQWSRGEIIEAVKEAAGCVSSATFVEYGYYADRQLLATMAEKAGGTLILAENFDKYAPTFDATIQKRVAGKRVELSIEGDPVAGFAFAMDKDHNLLTFEVGRGGKIAVPEDLNRVYYVSTKSVGHVPTQEPSDVTDACYAAMSLYAIRMKSDVVYAFLKTLGDVEFINQFSQCFGKQRYSAFVQDTQQAAFDSARRMRQGFNPKLVPPDDAFTLLELVELLAADKGNRLMLDDPSFVYKPMSRGRVDADENLSVSEAEAVATITDKMAKEKNAAKLKALQEELAAITSKKREALKFVPDPAPDGYPASGLTLNEERPNISVLVRKTGTVDLTSRNPPSGALPNPFPTFIFRNYNVIKDGLTNIDVLPAKLTPATLQKMLDRGCPMAVARNHVAGVTALDLKALPIINRKMVKEVSAGDLGLLQWELTKKRAAQKVYNSYLKELAANASTASKSPGFAAAYGNHGADFLAEQGISEFYGFSPKKVVAPVQDVYLGKFLSVKIKGYSSLPSVKEVKERMTDPKKKQTPSGALMVPAVNEVEEFFKESPQKLHAKWLEGRAEATVAEVRSLLFKAAQIKFAIIVGQVWFKEFQTLEENELTLKADGLDLPTTFEMVEKEIEI